MIKILTYIENPLSKTKGYSRAGDNGGIRENRISAEQEIDELLKDGWSIISSTTSEVITGAFAATTSTTKLVVILQHND